jgi:ribonuclease P protein component
MYTFSKAERLYKRSLIEKLFSNENCSFVSYPLRVIYMPMEEADSPTGILISVSKRKFKFAVRRNRVKRQIREAYRLNKSLLNTDKHWLIAFVYLSDALVPSTTIVNSVQYALKRIAENE